MVDCLGRARATWMGVRLPDTARRGQLLAALAPALRPAYSAAAEQLHLLLSSTTDGSAAVTLVTPEVRRDCAPGQPGPGLVVGLPLRVPRNRWRPGLWGLYLLCEFPTCRPTRTLRTLLHATQTNLDDSYFSGGVRKLMVFRTAPHPR